MPRFNFANKGNRNSDNSSNNNYRDSYEEREDSVVEEDFDARGAYSEVLRELWKLIIFCIVGWIVVVVGMCLDTNVLVMLLGVLIIDFPAIQVVLAGGGIAALFASSFNVTTVYHYSDGSKREDHSGQYAGMAAFIFGMIIAIVVGVVTIVIRIFKAFFTLLKIKKEGELKTETKDAPWLPIVVGIAVFIVGSIVAYNAPDLTEAFVDYTESEYEDSEELAIFGGAYDATMSRNFTYAIGTTEDQIAEVKYSPALMTYNFTITEYGAEKLGVAKGSYVGKPDDTGYFAVEGVTDDNVRQLFLNMTINKMIEFGTITTNLDKFAIKGDYEYNCYYNVATADGGRYTRIRFINNRIDMIINPMNLDIPDYSGEVQVELYNF